MVSHREDIDIWTNGTVWKLTFSSAGSDYSNLSSFIQVYKCDKLKTPKQQIRSPLFLQKSSELNQALEDVDAGNRMNMQVQH